MPPPLRRLALFVHVLASVGFPGAVACFFALAVVGLVAPEELTRRAAYLSMEAINSIAIVPLCWLSLLSGIACSAGTPWGLVRYYWVAVKLLATGLSALVLTIHLAPISRLARLALDDRLEAGLSGAGLQLAMASGLAVGVLVLLTGLSIYKPRGLTPWGATRLAAVAKPAGRGAVAGCRRRGRRRGRSSGP